MIKNYFHKILLISVVFFLSIAPLRGSLKIQDLTIGTYSNGAWFWEAVLKNEGGSLPQNIVKAKAIQLPTGPFSEEIVKQPIPHNGTVTIKKTWIRRCTSHTLRLELWKAKYNPKAPKSPPTWIKTSVSKTIPIPALNMVIKNFICKPDLLVQQWGVKVKNLTPYATKITIRAQVPKAFPSRGLWIRAGEYEVVVPGNSAVSQKGSFRGAKPMGKIKVDLLYFEKPGSQSCLLDSKTVTCK